MARTALSIAVPLDGTDRELGLKQLEQFASRKQTFRSQYKRFHGPFVEYTTPEELRNGLRDWKELLHCSARDIRLGLAVYTVPGSLLALSERLDENLARFLVLQKTRKLILCLVGELLLLIIRHDSANLGSCFGCNNLSVLGFLSMAEEVCGNGI